MVAANKTAEVISTGYGKGLRLSKNALGTVLRNQKKIEKGIDVLDGYFGPMRGGNIWQQTAAGIAVSLGTYDWLKGHDK